MVLICLEKITLFMYVLNECVKRNKKFFHI